MCSYKIFIATHYKKPHLTSYFCMSTSNLGFPLFNVNFSVNAGASETPALPGSSGGESTAANSDLGPEIPEGVDPSFLAALPDEMREEVIAEQLRYDNLCSMEFLYKGLTHEFLEHLKRVDTKLSRAIFHIFQLIAFVVTLLNCLFSQNLSK